MQCCWSQATRTVPYQSLVVILRSEETDVSGERKCLESTQNGSAAVVSAGTTCRRLGERSTRVTDSVSDIGNQRSTPSARLVSLLSMIW